MKTLPIGTVVEYKGIKLKVNRASGRDSCNGCHAHNKGMSACVDITDVCGLCGSYARADGVGVIFKKISR